MDVKTWGFRQFNSWLAIEKFHVDDEYDRDLLLNWGFWVEEQGTPSHSPPITDKPKRYLRDDDERVADD